MIEIDGLNAGYKRLHVLYDISLRFEKDKINVVVGPNGSGKSTLLKSIFGLTTIYSGSIKFNGVELNGLMPHQIARRGIAYLPQVDNVFSNLTVAENMLMAGYTLRGGEVEERIEEVSETFPVIKRYWRSKAGVLSGGERQMVAMAMALLRRPKVMMFDEPTGSLAPKIANEVLKKIVELKDQLKITIILVEQNAKKALEIGDKAYLLVSGRLVFHGDAHELLEHPQLGKLYLGISG
ncbi:MAG: ABC transporter ATP-binding protein [Candidatus Wolframiiraptor sp. EX4484-121]|nr:MAG: ABC transporter ATP-binding protein [Candidatus Wolframiiraptor sp. EX4484-121]